MNRLEDLNLKLNSLVVFRGLRNDAVIRALTELLSQDGKSLVKKIDDYSAFVSLLFQKSESLTDYIRSRMEEDENLYVLKRACGEESGPALEQCVASELKILEEISLLTAREVKTAIGYGIWMPEWTTETVDFTAAYRRVLDSLSTRGYGVFSRYHMFTTLDSGVVPVKYPDPVRLSDLKGYERERKTVVDNTRALLGGKPAANVLLYGDAGTGKSSTVKAIVNEFCGSGLRLIEIRKNRLLELPAVIESLHRNPLKFILFIDDLSFAGENEEIGVLKAILEGTVSAKAPNIVIYATSNRRHIVNERFSDRGRDEIHANETIQEQTSLSERFGLAVNFSAPDRDQYISIVDELAAQYGLRDTAELELGAERYALERGGRSPRVAKQFVDYLRSEDD